MARCYLCGVELTQENQSVEHIFLNALGGTYKSNKILCTKCNNELGKKCDAPLSAQLATFTTLLGIKRENGKNRPVFAIDSQDEGIEYEIKENGMPVLAHPVVRKQEMSNGTEYSVQVNSCDELGEIAKNISEKTNIPVEDILKNAQPVRKKGVEYKLRVPPLFGKEVFPSLLKTAVNTYIDVTGNYEPIQNAIGELKKCIEGKSDCNCVQPIFLEKDIFDLNDGEVCHSVFLKGETGKKLYAVVQYFNFYSVLVKLEENYTGNDIECLKVFDVFARKELDKKVTYILSYDFVFNYTYANADLKFEIQQKRIASVVDFISERMNKNYQKYIIYTICNCLKNKIDIVHNHREFVDIATGLAEKVINGEIALGDINENV